MKQFQVTIAHSVTRQISEQVLFIAKDSIDNALNWEVRLLDAIRSIGRFPGLTIDEDASNRTGFPLRKYVFEGTYLVHYWIDDTTSTINIIGFRHGARLPRRGEP